jgi:hypothetical protein
MSNKDRYICRLDFTKKSVIPRTLENLARHVGMKDDKPHIDWRKRHGFPEKMDDMRILNKTLPDIKQAILQDKDDFIRF